MTVFIHRSVALMFLCLVACGCESLDLGRLTANSWMTARAEGDSEEIDYFADFEDVEDEQSEVSTKLLGEYTTVSGLNMPVLQGVGLVVGLPGTGEDPPASSYRAKILDEMRRYDVKDPNYWLSLPSTAVVIVTAYMPPLAQPGDNFDVEVRVPPESQVTSLNGGRLLECRLAEQALIPGKGILEGDVLATAQGHVLVSASGGDGSADLGMLLRGRVVGGGRAKKSRDMQFIMRSDYRSVRMSSRIADRIGERFHDYDRYGHRIPLAEAKDDKRIELKIHPRYKDNHSRYIRVIQNIVLKETNVERRVRMEQLRDQLQVPETSEVAALQLEAIGHDAIPMLKAGLKSPLLECRFHAATALAYLGNAEGTEALYEAAKNEPAFRAFAFAAMAAADDSAAYPHLRELMNEESTETRYGAFRAMSVLDENDPFIRGLDMNDEFTLHIVGSSGEPMVHLTHRQKSEVVLFGPDQELVPPLALNAGVNIRVVARPGSDKITVSKHMAGAPSERQQVGLTLAEVIQAAARMGATYPDIAQLLTQADQQKNLQGRLAIDALPQTGRFYERPDTDESFDEAIARRTKVGHAHMAPNIYQHAPGEQTDQLTYDPSFTPADEEAGDDAANDEEVDDEETKEDSMKQSLDLNWEAEASADQTKEPKDEKRTRPDNLGKKMRSIILGTSGNPFDYSQQAAPQPTPPSPPAAQESEPPSNSEPTIDF